MAENHYKFIEPLINLIKTIKNPEELFSGPTMVFGDQLELDGEIYFVQLKVVRDTLTLTKMREYAKQGKVPLDEFQSAVNELYPNIHKMLDDEDKRNSALNEQKDG